MKTKPEKLVGLDGYMRLPDEEENINFLFSNQFKTTEGKALLAYLRSITIESVAGSDITDHALRHLEGQRYIVGLMQRRVNKGLSQTTIKEGKDE